MSVNTTSSAIPPDSPIRVMVVDDSAVIRGFFTRFIETAPDLKVVASAGNGEQAVSLLDRMSVDVVLLDIEMPVMDGTTALPLFLKKDPALGIIMASSLTQENAQLALKCLQMGATECIAKPTSSEMQGSNTFQETLIIKVRAAGLAARRKRGGPGASLAVPAPRAPVGVEPPSRGLTLRPVPAGMRAPDVVAIGSSTGGPQALMRFFGDLKTPLRQPVVVTQHMPATFTPILAENIERTTGLPCREAKEGEPLLGGNIYIAPGNYHMTVKGSIAAPHISLNQDPPENFCRPSVDPMLRSLVQIYGARILTVILTGMGADGLKGSQAVVEAGGVILAQDEATSVVWGMPGAVATAGICSQVLPLERLAQIVRDAADGRGIRS